MGHTSRSYPRLTTRRWGADEVAAGRGRRLGAGGPGLSTSGAGSEQSRRPCPPNHRDVWGAGRAESLGNDPDFATRQTV
jgi:hypothetical protein